MHTSVLNPDLPTSCLPPGQAASVWSSSTSVKGTISMLLTTMAGLLSCAGEEHTTPRWSCVSKALQLFKEPDMDFHLSSLFLTHSLPPSFTHSLTLTLSLTLCGSIHKEGVHLACADALIDAGANLDHMVRSYVCMCALHVCICILRT